MSLARPVALVNLFHLQVVNDTAATFSAFVVHETVGREGKVQSAALVVDSVYKPLRVMTCGF